MELSGLNFAITGKLLRFKRKDIEKLIIDNGGYIQSMVNSKTDYLLTGFFQMDMFQLEKFSRKRKVAEKLINEGVKIKIIDEEAFFNMFDIKS